MKNVFLLFVHPLTTVATMLKPTGARAIVAENLLLKQQLLITARSRRRAPNLTLTDRFLLGFLSLFLRPHRIARAAIVVRPSTLLRFHQALVRKKYRELFAPRSQATPGPKGPAAEIVEAIIELKRRSPRFGCPRIALIINRTFDVDINKDVVRRVLGKYYRPEPGDGPSWLTFIGHMKDSLWSVDLFRCESILLNSHWVMVVMDQFTRRIIGFAVCAGDVDGPVLCRMFNQIIAGQALPRYLSADNSPFFEYHRWQANLRVVDIEEIKTVPYAPLSHPFVGRLIGICRREYLDHVLFWNACDLQRKLTVFQIYFNELRVHSSVDGRIPTEVAELVPAMMPPGRQFRWESVSRGMYGLPIAA